MNTLEGSALENRLREALAERAAHSPLSPDAWDKTVARGDKPGRRTWFGRPSWLSAGLVIPAAAAIAVAAVILAATTLTGRDVLSGRPATAVDPASARPGPYGSPAAPPGPGNGMYDVAPPITSMIEFR
jgi:hypothetical protein